MTNTIKIKENEFPMTLGVKEVSMYLGIGEKSARKEIKELNQELIDAGKRVIKGRVFTEYFLERYAMV